MSTIQRLFTPMTFLHGIIANKPIFGFSITAGGFVSGLLTWIGVLTPIIGFIGAVIGLAAAVITLMIKWREWRSGSRNNFSR